MANTYYAGSLVRSTATFKVGATPTDPSTVTVRTRSPDGVITTRVYLTDATVLRDSTGVYHYDISVPVGQASVGEWLVQWIGTGAAQAAAESRFIVLSTGFPA